METNVLQTLLDMQIDNTQYYKNETKKLREENEKLKNELFQAYMKQQTT